MIHLLKSEVIESDWIFPMVNGNGSVKLNVTTNSTLSTNMFYQATITTMDMTEAGSFQFSKRIICIVNQICHIPAGYWKTRNNGRMEYRNNG